MKGDITMKLFEINLQMFAEANTQTTWSANLTPEMKTYYSDYLIDTAAPKLVHDQFGQKHPIPKNGGKTIEFRKFNPLPKLLTPLTEGVTPDGQTMSVSKIEATVQQYGGYVTLSDMYLLSAIDNNLVYATKLLGNQAGSTLDTITREVLNGGTNVIYAGNQPSRSALVSLKTAEPENCVLKVSDIKKAVRALKVQNAPKIGDSYVGIIHPDVTYDLTNDPEWKYPHQYVDTDEIYSGEIGRIAGVRFVESSEAKVMQGKTPMTINGTSIVAAETVSTASTVIPIERNPYINPSIVGKVISFGVGDTKVVSYTENAITVESARTVNKGDIAVMKSAGTAVYSTLILGEDAYGVTEIEGGGLEHITKPLGAGEDALNQRATCGWKATKVAERLVEPYMVRIESCSTFDAEVN